MLIYPAIDLRGGQVVRLTKGDYDRETVYLSDPAEAANAFRVAGAHCIHMVDLDGARDGSQQNLNAVVRVAAQGGWFLEMGGGARNRDAVRRMLDTGVNRVILGTLAIEQPETMEVLAKEFPGKIAVGVDASNGFVAIHGWRTVTDIPAEPFIRSLPNRGVNCVIYTDISKDGMLQGPSFSAYEALADVKGLDVIASGGVTSVADVKRLSQMGLYGAIIGKALYDGRISLEEAIAVGKENAPC